VMPEPGRQVAFVLADALTTWDDSVDEERNNEAVNLAWQRLNEIDGAVTATLDDATGEVTISLSNVLGGALVAMNWLLALAEASTGLDRLEVIANMREFLASKDDT
jgi:hypothetical protein